MSALEHARRDDTALTDSPLTGATPTLAANGPANGKNDALAELVRRRLAARPVDPRAITARDSSTPLVLSYQQERLFALDQIVDNLLAYNQAQAFRVRGHLDVDALATAVLELQLRHDILRTCVRLADGEVVVLVSEPRPLEVVVAPAAVDDAAIAAMVTDEVRRPLDLSTNGPMRITVITVSEDDHVLVMSLHHIACDDVSKRVIFADLSSLYDAIAAGRTPDVARPALQFSDYANWQRQSLERGSTPALDWWVDYLAGAPASTNLPLDRPRPAIATNHGAKLRSQLSATAMEALTSVSRAAGATPFMALLAGFAWLLEQYGSDGEVVIGMPVSGRGRDEVRSMVGLFLNTLPVRIDTHGDPTFVELLGQVRESTVGVLGHQDVPFELILDAVRPERDPSRAPISQVMCTMRSESGTQPHFAGSQVAAVGYDGGWTKFDLGLTGLLRSDGTLDLLWQFNTDLFDRRTIEILADHLSTMLTAASVDPFRPMSEVAAPSEAHRELVISRWNDTYVDGLPEQAYHHLMHAQVDRTPTAVAVVDESRSLTFQQLDERANQVAHELLRRGVATGDIVAISMQRSTECEAAILGVLKAGAAYLPLDAAYPPARLEFMLRDSDARVILADRASAPTLPVGTPRIVLDAAEDPIRERSKDRPDVVCGPDDLAYVIYTSGSTGQPKGVLCEHGGLINRLMWMVRRFEIGPGDILLQKTPMSFDVSLTELLLPPICGASIVMAAPERHGDPQYLRDVIDEHGITHVHFVPSMLSAFLLSTPADSCPSLRMITTTGEPLALETAHQCRQLMPHAVLHNLYGPTEASIEVTATPALETDTPRMTIGRPIDNIRTYVLDERRAPVPVGAIGELYLAGVGVARGYLNRDELTAERFLTDPFVGGRMYRTGDRARWLPDGQIDFLGRVDDQVKMRGFRIELGEVEAAMASLDGVAAAVCAVHDPGGSGDASLFGYVVASDVTQPPNPAVLRKQLARLLPAYEVPSVIGVIETIPVSSSGKADRRRLPALVDSSVAEEIVGPRDDIERRVSVEWQRVLGSEGELSVNDNYFDIGGNSLSALRLFARLEAAFGVSIPLSMMIEGVTIAETAAHIKRARSGNDVTDMVLSMRSGTDLPPLFAMPHFRGDLLVYRRMLAGFDSRRPVYGVQCRGIDGRGAPRMTIEEVAEDCILAMRTRQPHGPYHVFGFCFSGVLAYEVARQLREADEEVAFVGVIDAPAPRGATTSSGSGGRWRRRVRRVAGGGLGAGIVTVQAFARRRIFRLIAVTYARLGRRIPPRYVDFYYANSMALKRYVPQPSDVHLALIRRATSSPDERARQNTWGLLARRGVSTFLMDDGDADHHTIVQFRFAERVAQAVNEALAASTEPTSQASPQEVAVG